MESLKLFTIFKNKFVHLIAQVFIPIIFIIALDQLVKFIKNISKDYRQSHNVILNKGFNFKNKLHNNFNEFSRK